MGWLLAVGASAALAALAFLLYDRITAYLELRAELKQQRAVRQQQAAAEGELQQRVHHTISQMLDSARRLQ
jgi:hypothetical protein